jgi:hypothetical protein
MSLFLFSCDGPEDEDLTAPDTPTNFVINASSSTDGQIELTWDANSENDLAGYILYRNGVGATAAFDSIATLDKNATSYEDVNLDYDTEYFYKLLALDENDNYSELTDAVSAIPTNWNPPAAVTNLIIHAHNLPDEGRVNVELRWDSNTEDDFSYYVVYSVGDGNVTTALDTTTTPDFTDTNVTPGVTYTYLVRAYDKDDPALQSNISAIVSDTPLVAPELLAPISIDPLVSLTPSFQWNGVQGATRYRIQVKQSLFADDLWTEYVDAGTASSYMETYAGTTLTPSTTYWWFISAYSGDPDDVNVRSVATQFKTTSM